MPVYDISQDPQEQEPTTVILPRDTPAAIALERAADLLAKPHGWIKNQVSDGVGICSIGAIMRVTGVKNDYDLVVAALIQQIRPDTPFVDPIAEVCRWNNGTYQTQDEVVAAFRDAATLDRFKLMEMQG